jgi:hypothetical protein
MNKKGRPRIPAAEKRVKVAITLTPEHHQKTARNRSRIIAEALKEFFEKSE